MPGKTGRPSGAPFPLIIRFDSGKVSRPHRKTDRKGHSPLSMFRYLIRRLLWACVLFLVITIVTFVIFFMIPVNPAKQACGQRASPRCIELAKHTLGLDRPLPVQYLKFMD